MAFKKMFFLIMGLLYYTPHTSGMDYVPLFTVAKIPQAKKNIVHEFVINDINNPQTKKIIELLKQYEKRDLQNQFGWCTLASIAGGALMYMGIPEVGIFPSVGGAMGACYAAMIIEFHNAGYGYLYNTEDTPQQHNLLTLAGRSALQRNIHKTVLDPKYNAENSTISTSLELFNAQKNKTRQWNPNDPEKFKKIISGKYNSERWALVEKNYMIQQNLK